MLVLGIAIATIASFVASALLYALPPVAALLRRSSTPRPGIPMAVQLGSVVLRSLIASLLVAGLLVSAGWHGAGAGAVLGLALAVIPAILMLGSVIHENTAVAVAAIHLLDWVVKLLLIGAIVGSFT